VSALECAFRIRRDGDRRPLLRRSGRRTAGPTRARLQRRSATSPGLDLPRAGADAAPFGSRPTRPLGPDAPTAGERSMGGAMRPGWRVSARGLARGEEAEAHGSG